MSHNQANDVGLDEGGFDGAQQKECRYGSQDRLVVFTARDHGVVLGEISVDILEGPRVEQREEGGANKAKPREVMLSQKMGWSCLAWRVVMATIIKMMREAPSCEPWTMQLLSVLTRQALIMAIGTEMRVPGPVPFGMNIVTFLVKGSKSIVKEAFVGV